MIKIAICDDDLTITSELNKMLTGWSDAPSAFYIECFDNGDALISAHRTKAFDIILLDIVMPVLNGIDTSMEIREFDKSVKIVFLTSSPEFAIDSYSVKASNYLLKPADSGKLFACISELASELKTHDKQIIIKESGVNHRVAVSSIEYLEAQNKHVKFVFKDGSNLVSLDKFYTCEERLLPEVNFFKCHRSYIVNLYQVSKFSLKEIVMRSGAKIPISRSLQKEFEAAYFSVIFGEAGGNK